MTISTTPTYPVVAFPSSTEQVITFANGPPIKAWRVTVKIAGRTIGFKWDAGDSNAIGATKCANAINAAAASGLPASAAAASGAVTVTFSSAPSELITAEQAGGAIGNVVAGNQVAVTSSLTAGDRAVVALTSVPPESNLRLGLLTKPTPVHYISAISVAFDELETADFTPDVPGEYGVTVYIYRLIPGLPSFDGDRGGERRAQLVTSESATIHVGAQADLPIVTIYGDGAKLRLNLVDETVRDADLVEPTTEKARVAATQSTVTSALTALVGQTVSAMGTDLQTGANNLRDNYARHRILIAGGEHAAADNTNVVNLDDCHSQEGAIRILNLVRTALVAHAQDATAAATPWHSTDDLKNAPLVGPATNIAQATVLSADLRERVYERHRIQTATPASHGAADNTNALAAPTKLDDVIVAYLDALATTNPSAPAGEAEGAQDAGHRYGFAPPEI